MINIIIFYHFLDFYNFFCKNITPTIFTIKVRIRKMFINTLSVFCLNDGVPFPRLSLARIRICFTVEFPIFTTISPYGKSLCSFTKNLFTNGHHKIFKTTII